MAQITSVTSVQKRKRSGNFEMFSWNAILIVWTILISMLDTSNCNDCSLPETLHGQWFINEFAIGLPIIINSSTNSISRHIPKDNYSALDNCVWNNEDLYIFKNIELDCYRCILLSAKHENVLYSREESNCVKDKEWDPLSLCEQLKNSYADDNHFFWFRENYKPVDCPIRDDFLQFSYSLRDGKVCGNPISHSTSCLNTSIMKLDYEGCPDISERVVEELTCVGTWEDSGHAYFVADVKKIDKSGRKQDGSLRERFRCFVYSTSNIANRLPGKPPVVTGYQVGTFESATCKGLHSPDEAETILYLKRENPTDDSRPCSFPSWFTSHKWLDWSESFEIERDPELKNIGSIISRPINREGHNAPKIEDGGSNYNLFTDSKSSVQKTNLFRKLVCLQKTNLTDEGVKILAKYRFSCEIKEVCLHLVKRSEQVAQLYYLENDLKMKRDVFRKRCLNSTLAEPYKYFTLVSSQGTRDCQRPGKYLRKPAFSDDPFIIGCEKSKGSLIETNEAETKLEHEHSYSCLDSWTENNTTFTVMLSRNKKIPGFFCSVETDTATCAENGDIIFTSQDCIHKSYEAEVIENEFQNLDTANLTNASTFKLYRNGSCDSSSADENADCDPENLLLSGASARIIVILSTPVYTTTAIVLLTKVMYNFCYLLN